MPTPSPWPLNPHSLRCLVPPFACQELARHPLSHELYPQALGYYRQAAGHEMHREGPEHEVDFRGSVRRQCLLVGAAPVGGARPVRSRNGLRP